MLRVFKEHIFTGKVFDEQKSVAKHMKFTQERRQGGCAHSLVSVAAILGSRSTIFGQVLKSSTIRTTVTAMNSSHGDFAKLLVAPSGTWKVT